MNLFNFNKIFLINFKLITKNGVIRRLSTKNSSTNTIKPSYIHCVGSEPLVFRTIGEELNLACDKYGDNKAIVSCAEQKSYTFNEVRYEADRLAAGLLQLGLKKGDTFGIWSPNTTNWYISMLAAARIGLLTVGLNPAFQIPEMLYCLEKVNVKAVIAPESFKTQRYNEMLQKMALILNGKSDGMNEQEKRNLLIIIDSKSKLPDAYHLPDIKSIANDNDINQIENLMKSISPDSPCNIQFSSGTTGQPKAAVLSHFQFVNNGYQVGKRSEFDRKHHIICLQNPLFHAFGIVITVMSAMAFGSTIVMPGPTFNAKDTLDAIVNEKCTIIHGTPTMYVDLVAKQNELGYQLKTPEIAVTGGAPCPPELFRNIKSVLGLKKVKTVYGLTETTAVVSQSQYEENEYQVCETVGQVLEHIELKVIDEYGNAVPMGTPGELCIRGYSTMLGYYGDEINTKKMISNDKWLMTGDQFILQEDGYGKIVGRLKDMIIRGGENIFPIEIENHLNMHPNILECHVFGVPDSRMGEEICAAVRLRQPSSSSGSNGPTEKQLILNDIREFCKNQLAHFKIPRYVQIVDDAFPKTVSGKIQKFKLRESFIKEKVMLNKKL